MKRKITSNQLRNLILQEAKKLQKEGKFKKPQDVSKVKAKEYQAGEEADTLEKDIDIMKALKIKEAKINEKYRVMLKRMRKLQERKLLLRKRILKNI